MTRQIPFRAGLTLHDGQTVVLRESWTGDRPTEESADMLLALLSRYKKILKGRATGDLEGACLVGITAGVEVS